MTRGISDAELSMYEQTGNSVVKKLVAEIRHERQTSAVIVKALHDSMERERALTEHLAVLQHDLGRSLLNIKERGLVRTMWSALWGKN